MPDIEHLRADLVRTMEHIEHIREEIERAERAAIPEQQSTAEKTRLRWGVGAVAAMAAWAVEHPRHAYATSAATIAAAAGAAIIMSPDPSLPEALPMPPVVTAPTSPTTDPSTPVESPSASNAGTTAPTAASERVAPEPRLGVAEPKSAGPVGAEMGIPTPNTPAETRPPVDPEPTADPGQPVDPEPPADPDQPVAKPADDTPVDTPPAEQDPQEESPQQDRECSVVRLDLNPLLDVCLL